MKKQVIITVYWNLLNRGDNLKSKIIELRNIIRENKSRSIGMMILGILVLIFLVFIAIYLLGTKNVSNIERKTIEDNSKKLLYNIEDIVLSDSKDIDKYIIYALKYSYNVNNKNALTVDEIYNFLNENFVLKITKKDIKNLGVTPIMASEGIVYNNESKKYLLTIARKGANEVIETPITYYKLEKISKKSKKRYVVTYRQYTINDPYKMLNYYIEKNNSSNESTDINIIRNYIMGNEKLYTLKNFIKDEDIHNYAKKGKRMKITYIYEDDKIKIEKIK